MENRTAAARPIRVASYNIRKCVGLDGRRDPLRVLSAISALDADVVALQEADRRLGPRPTALPRRLIEAETDFEPVMLPGSGVSLGWHGNAVLVRKGAAVSRVRPITLPGLEPRGALQVELEAGGATLRLVATHLGLMRRHRRAQLAALTGGLAELAPCATAILGDFNEWSAGRGLEALTPGFAVHAPGRSFHAARPIAALDRIATCGRLEMHDAGVREDALTRRASDHLPVWADLEFRTPGQPVAAQASSG
ncbi:metal-dependent hydrolase [Maritimibacter sp. 55A14]|uniref:endonuclease/exonuclease/phosphatase family protein n=1 Tax=Maritimibacter sp. 55A14 TaxID=2174844 RepID=UPI000D60D03B|nr:endonuclease/exonuclease/phosphatase family protein [Maritimibacter sp. 55A14]PWE28850.1 metal-dependent hydrolase [Maritimibacter sp. 55A14]